MKKVDTYESVSYYNHGITLKFIGAENDIWANEVTISKLYGITQEEVLKLITKLLDTGIIKEEFVIYNNIEKTNIYNSKVIMEIGNLEDNNKAKDFSEWLSKIDKGIKKTDLKESQPNQLSDFNQKLLTALNFNPKKGKKP